MNYFDLHFHGAFGVDVTDARPDALAAMQRQLLLRGTSEYLPTLIPLPIDRLDSTLAVLGAEIASRRPGDGRGARPVGIHLEGPFVSKQRAGALHPDCFVDMSREDRVRRVLDLLFATPGSHMLTIAPEIAGGLEIISECRQRGVLVSVGHTDATFTQLEAAFAAGARHMTHFCNAMRPLHHREPGPIGFGLLEREISVDLIADFHHLHPRMVEFVLRSKGPGRVALISDAIPAAGLPAGEYSIWGETLTVKDGCVRNRAGALAGSICLQDEGVANLRALGISEAAATACAADVPRAILANARIAPNSE